MVVLHWLEVRVVHRISGSHSLGVVVLEHLGKQVNCLVTHQLVVLRCDKFGPRFTRVLAQNIIVVRVELHVILVNVRKQLISA